jgi:hypothetical protein
VALPLVPDVVSVFFGVLVSVLVSDVLELDAPFDDELPDEEGLSVLVDSVFLPLEP